MPAPAWAQDLFRALFQRTYGFRDVSFVGLAAVLTVLLAIRTDVPEIPPSIGTAILWIDRAGVLLFALEYVVDLARAGDRRRFVRSTWYDLVGMIPLPIPILRAFRLLRIPHVILWGQRVPGREAAQEPYALEVFRRFEPVIVEEITDPVLLRVLRVLREAVAKGRYLQAVGEGLDARRDRLHAVVMESLRTKPALRLALEAPGAERLVQETEKQVFDVVIATLTNPELDAVLKESIDDALRGLERRIAEKEYELTVRAAAAATPA